MALEKHLWQRVKRATGVLRKCGFCVHVCRLENSAGEGNPDVEACIDGAQIWIELKSCERPKRETTLIRPKSRESQSIWHRERSEAGCATNWVLIQVGSASESRLYLIPGSRYDEITALESQLEKMCLNDSSADAASALVRATEGWR